MKFANQINIQDTISYMITVGNMFTAYDITKTLRHDGYHVKHRDVRDAVRDYGFPQGYTQEVHSSIGATVYFNKHSDIIDYNPNKIPEFVVNQRATPTASSSNSNSAPVSTSPQIVDKRSRFCIPASKLRDAGFMKGMQVKVLVDHDKIIIHNGVDGAEVTVDKSNNIRIAKGTLQNAFDTMPTTIKIDTYTNKVELSIDD